MNINKLQEKKETLKNVKSILKQEFFGIDRVIDELIENIQSWYFFNASQKHPLVVNLWGLTGTGKTSLINRLVDLLDMKEAYLRVEAGKIKNNDIEEDLTEFVKSYENEDYIICLDEFQHVRTIDSNGYEIEDKMEFSLWDFIDTGIFRLETDRFSRREFYTTYRALKIWVDFGITITNGKIYYDKQPKDAIPNLKESFGGDNEDYHVFLDRSERADLYKLFPEKFSSIFEFDKFYFSCNEKELLALLSQAAYRKRKSSYKQLNRSLIFVLGNLDEAYQMSKNFSPDLNADAFYQMSLEIKLPDIKEALKKRFRNEQISRLGNNHIIYPALDKKAYQLVIHNYLNQIHLDYQKLYNINVEFHASVHDIVYSNGVIPTQGVRPLLSSLKTLIHARMGEVICHLAVNAHQADQVKISYAEKHFEVVYSQANKPKGVVKLPVSLTLDDIRNKKSKNKLAVTAIHEAGHAVVSLSLLNDIPRELTIKTADTYSDGFVAFDLNEKVITRKDLKHYAARFLAGLEAERLIFGEELITLGASSDLRALTRQLLKALNENGFGEKLGYYAQKGIFNQHVMENGLDTIEKEVEQLISEAQTLTTKTLKMERQLLLAIADQLIKKQKLNAEDIKALVNRHAMNFDVELLSKMASTEPHWELLKRELNAIVNFEKHRNEKRISA